MKACLEANKSRHAIIRCRECVTGRHLLERTLAAVRHTLQEVAEGETLEYSGRCENLSVLAASLQRLLRSKEKFILVFDDVDKQRDSQPTFLPALARLGEFVR